MSYNNNRFKLPDISLIGGSTKIVKLPFSDILESFSIVKCSSLENENTMIDSNGVVVIPNNNCIYIITLNSDCTCYLWDGEKYKSASYLFSMSRYTGISTDLIIEKICNVTEDGVFVRLSFEDTIELRGKFIYQVAVYNSEDNVVYFAEQGTALISKNIDFKDNILHGIEDGFVYEDEDIHLIYNQITSYVVGVDIFEENWLSETEGGEPLTPNESSMYIVQSGDYNGKYVWDIDTLTYRRYED